jgi:hypothetical protein
MTNHFKFKNLNLIRSKNISMVLHCSEHYFILQQASIFNQTILHDSRQHSDQSNSNLTGVIHKEYPTRCNSVSKIYFIFIWSSTCFGWHTTHHQEPKTALAASGFACVEGCWTYNSHRKSNKMQQCIKILFHNYVKLNMFRATHHPSSGA